MPTVAASRLYNIYSTLKANGHTVKVVTSEMLYNFGPVENPDIETVGIMDYRWMRQKWGNKQLHFSAPSSTQNWKQVLGRVLRSLPMAYLIGEGGGVYFWSAYKKAAQLIKEHSIDTVISSFAPLTDHLIAARLKKQFPQLRWIADFRDLPIDGYKRNIVAPNWHQSRFRKIFSEADLCWAVSHGQAGELQRILDRAVSVVRNGLDQEYRIPESVQGESEFTISYTGSLYPFYPSELWKKVLSTFAERLGENAHKAVLRYAGKDGATFSQWAKQAQWPGEMVDLGELSKEACWRIQQYSTVNLLMTWNQEGSRGVLTGKLYEYLAARKPILALSNGDCDEELSKLIVSQHGSQSLCTDDIKMVGIFLEATYNRYSSGDELLLGDFDQLQELFFQLPESTQT